MKLEDVLNRMLHGEISPDEIDPARAQLNDSDQKIFDMVLELISKSIDSGAIRAVDAVIDLVEGMQTKDRDKIHEALEVLTVCNVPPVFTLKLWAVITGFSLASISKLAKMAEKVSEDDVDIDSLNRELDELLKN